MKFCSKCGNQIDENTTFCPKCSYNLGGAKETLVEPSVIRRAKEKSKYLFNSVHSVCFYWYCSAIKHYFRARCNNSCYSWIYYWQKQRRKSKDSKHHYVSHFNNYLTFVDGSCNNWLINNWLIYNSDHWWSKHTNHLFPFLYLERNGSYLPKRWICNISMFVMWWNQKRI